MSKVRFFRIQNKLTQSEVAKRTNMTATELSLVENDKLLPTPQKAERLCRILKVKLPQLYAQKEITFSKSDYRTGNKSISNLCVRFDANKRSKYLSDKVMSKLGYKSVKEWAEIKALETFNEYKELSEDDANITIFEYEIEVKATLEHNGKSEPAEYTKVVEVEALDDSFINEEVAKRTAVRSARLTAEIIGGKLNPKTISTTIKKCTVKSNTEV